MHVLYTFGLRIFSYVSQFLQLFSERHRKWWRGRRGQTIDRITGTKPIWIHCASLGEFEQGRPLIEEIRHRWPQIPIILTFFSPSGYEVRANYPHVEKVYYLPIDLPASVSDFLSLVQPRLAIFVKYEFWFNYLRQLQHRSIPTIFISVLIKPNHFLLRPMMRPMLGLIKSVDQIFVQDLTSEQVLKERQFENVTIVGDTRVDRVLQIKEQPRSFGWLDDLAAKKRTIVYGSIWPEDLEHLRSFISAQEDPNTLHVVAPHRPEQSFLEEINALQKAGYTARLSQIDQEPKDLTLLIVDTLGDLAYLYRWAWLSYVGGGFGDGVHSILEPAAYFHPVIIGPNHHHFYEARHLIDEKAVYEVQSGKDFGATVYYLEGPDAYRTAVTSCKNFFRKHEGATTKIVQYLSPTKWLE